MTPIDTMAIPGRTWSVRLWMVMLLLVVSMTAVPADHGQGAELPPFRVAFSSSVLTDVNESDARAAIKAWAISVAQERGIDVAPDAEILAGLQDMVSALRDGRCEYATMSTDEFLQLDASLRPDSLYLSIAGGSQTEEYLLLVNAESGLNAVGDLVGGSMILFNNARACLTEEWLDLELAKRGMGRTSVTCRSLTRASKLSSVVLPVFFGSADACVVTANGFATMSELNPQVGRTLKVLARSPALIPSVSFFRKSYQGDVRTRIEREIGLLGETAAGSQVLNLFQCENIHRYPVSVLDETRRLLESWTEAFGMAEAIGTSGEGKASNPGDRQ